MNQMFLPEQHYLPGLLSYCECQVTQALVTACFLKPCSGVGGNSKEKRKGVTSLSWVEGQADHSGGHYRGPFTLFLALAFPPSESPMSVCQHLPSWQSEFVHPAYTHQHCQRGLFLLWYKIGNSVCHCKSSSGKVRARSASPSSGLGLKLFCS